MTRGCGEGGWKRKRRIDPQIKKINTDEKRRNILARRRGREERLLRRWKLRAMTMSRAGDGG
jgi:hypothetical protein